PPVPKTPYLGVHETGSSSAIALGHCRRRIDRALKIVSFGKEPDEAALQLELTRQIKLIDVAAIGREVRQALADAITARDLPALLKVYDRKDQVLAGLAAMKGVKKDAFVAWVARAMKGANRPELRDAVRSMLPVPIAS
ncbi:hypothetical protein, partial [Sphingomonas sp. CFBP 8760]|uniref:hypothetical protein n=1 Tax=Sphingomonas sp. CFBP 8760 TaxID=2775282 RepID=UPI0018FE2B08